MEVLRANIREKEKLLGLCRGFFFFFFFGGWALRLWLVVVVVAVAMAVVRGNELEKLRPWRFREQISERGRSF